MTTGAVMTTSVAFPLICRGIARRPLDSGRQVERHLNPNRTTGEDRIPQFLAPLNVFPGNAWCSEIGSRDGASSASSLPPEPSRDSRVSQCRFSTWEDEEVKRATMNMLIASCAVFGIGTSAAFADCAEEISALHADAGSSGETDASGSSRSGIAKDGTLAPLEDGSNTGAEGAADGGDVATTTTAGEKPAGQGASVSAGGDNEIAKDGTQAPLAEDGAAAGGSGTGLEENSSIAVSQQDAEAQQDLASGANTDTRTEALERAQAALDRGDEEACMEAIEEARGT